MAIGRIPEPGTGIPESIIAAKGDILTGTANDTPAVLTAGTNETRLVADSGQTTGLKYVADTTNYAVAAKGDLLVGTAADTLAALSVGTNGHTLVADSVEATGLKWAAPAGGGKVLQVVQNTYSTQTGTQSTSFVDTGMTVTITPTLATSKVMIVISASIYMANGARADGNSGFKLIRAATDILTLDNSFHLNLNNVNSGALGGFFHYTYLDSPATTSSTIYKTQQKVENAASFIYTAIGSKVCTMTAYEIGV